MVDLAEFYREAHEGKTIDGAKVLDYLKGFPNILIWGAGNLGKAVGQKLLLEKIKIAAYWDIKYLEISFCNGIPVLEPFQGGFDPERTLVIPCITNGSLGNHWTERELERNGWHFYLSGMAFYEGVICPLNEKYFNIRECTGTQACSLCNCERYANLLNKKLNTPKALMFQLITFIISTRCTLNCRYCGQRLSQYKTEDIIDFAVADIKRDIDYFLGAVDFVGMISIIGGEPFLHPNLLEIVEHCLTKDNFGVVNITTNGVIKLTKELLQGLKNDRVKISFSIYDSYLSEKQKDLLAYNIEMVRQSGVSYSISYPLWIKPQELKDYKYDKEKMVEKKKNCDNIKMCAAVRNGFFYPCTTAENIESLHKFSAGNALVDVKEKENLRERLMGCLQQEYFEACRYCGSGEAEEIRAGEQVERSAIYEKNM